MARWNNLRRRYEFHQEEMTSDYRQRSPPPNVESVSSKSFLNPSSSSTSLFVSNSPHVGSGDRLLKSASSLFRLPNVSPPNVDRRGEDEHEVASTNFFEDSLRGMSTSRGAVGYVDSREKNTWITNNIGMLESLELKEVVRFAQSVEKFHALYPNQTLTWGKVIHSDVLSILVPILERLHREGLVGQQPTRYLANISWQELVRALADRVAPNSVPEMKSALAALVSKFEVTDVPTLSVWYSILSAFQLFSDALLFVTAKVGKTRQLPTLSMMRSDPNGFPAMLSELFSPLLINPILDEVFSIDAQFTKVPKPKEFRWEHLKLFLELIKSIVQHNIDESKDHEAYRARWTSMVDFRPISTVPKSPSATSPTRLLLLESHSERAVSPELLATRGPFGAPGSGQAREGFHMNGTKIQKHVQFGGRDMSTEILNDRAQVCYAYARDMQNGCTRTDCKFSHDPIEVLKHLQSLPKFKEMQSSPRGKPTLYSLDCMDLQSELDEISEE